MSVLENVGPAGPGFTPPRDEAGLRAASEKLEAAFLAEMLKAAKFGETPSAFGGGVGEDQFASFMTNAQAEAMVAAGGIGLAERIFESMARRIDNA